MTLTILVVSRFSCCSAAATDTLAETTFSPVAAVTLGLTLLVLIVMFLMGQISF